MLSSSRDRRVREDTLWSEIDLDKYSRKYNMY